MQYLKLFLQRYPNATAQDCIKTLYQAQFGCEHILGDGVLGYIKSELQQVSDANPNQQTPSFEPISNTLCRVHLAPFARNGYAPELLERLMRAVPNKGTAQGLMQNLQQLTVLADKGKISLDGEQTRNAVERYVAMGCPAVHHSEQFRQCYNPHYRLAQTKHAVLLPLLDAIGRCRGNKPVIVALDGVCGSGKSYFASVLQQFLGASVIHCDHFFLPKDMRTADRLNQIGGNIHYERLLQVIKKARLGKDFVYQAYDCSTGNYVDVTLPANPVVVVEGTYALHPVLRPLYDLCAMLTVPKSAQLQRLRARESQQSFQTFVDRWIPLENKYFDNFDCANCIVMDSSEVCK